MRSSARITLAATVAFIIGSQAIASSAPPPTLTDNVVDDYFGVRVADPYRWLEDGNSPRVRAWSAAQNAYARAALDRLPGRASLRSELLRLIWVDSVDVPTPAGDVLFYTRRKPGQNQPVLLVRRAADGPARVLVDPNKLSAGGTAALDWWYPSRDGRYVAYGISFNGDEQSTLYVINAASGKRLREAIPYTRGGPAAWLPDDSGFYYGRWRRTTDGKVVERRIYRHRLGEHAHGAGDALVFGAGLSEAYWADVDLSRNGRWLLLYIYHGAQNANDLEIRDLSRSGAATIIVNRGNDKSYYGEVVGDAFYALTDDGAERNRIVRIDLLRPQRSGWRTIVGERRTKLDSAAYAANEIVATYLENATSRLRIYSLNGRLERDVALATLGTVSTVGAQQTSGVFYYEFASYNTPPRIYRATVAGADSTLWWRSRAPVDPASYIVKQVWYRSKDGTRISMFIMHRRDLRSDGSAPTLLTGYGGFDVSVTPAFRPRVLTWVKHGGVFAEPNLRGGAEYGEAWHRAGMFERKQNVFDDFITAARWLIAHRYTSPQRLAIAGGSNGGLLVAAAETQAPQLFRAVDCEVPLTDMLRYHKFLIARLWTNEYGSSENPKQFRYLLKYSPYHNVRKGIHYPATFIVTAEDDTRVDPMNARKFAARLQADTAGPYPVYLRIEPKAGHGAGIPVSKQVGEIVDALAFLFYELGARI